MEKLIRYYVAQNGQSPFVEWMKKIKDHTMQSRIERRIERMALNNYGDYKFIGEGVYELRLDFGAGYRVYFAEQDETIVIILCGGDKSTQKRDIEAAKHFWQKLRSA